MQEGQWTEVQEGGEGSSSKILLWYVSPHKKVSTLLRDKELLLVVGCVCSGSPQRSSREKNKTNLKRVDDNKE